MPGAGRLNRRVFFYRLNETADDYGNVTTGYAGTAFLEVWGGLRPEKGREALEAGRLESSVPGVLTIRVSTDALTITEADKAVIGGEDYQIHSIANPDQRSRFLEMVVSRGVAQG